MKKTRFLAALAVATLGFDQMGVSQQSPSGPDLVFSWLRDAAAQLRSDGYQAYRDPQGLVLRNGQAASMQLPLEGSREYQILGMCDERCGNLDLALFDPAGNLLDSDNAQDNVPFISTQAARGGMYRLRVTMRECSSETCFFAITVAVK